MEKSEGQISTSMGVNTKPAHRLEFNGHWILVDPKMSQQDLANLKNFLGIDCSSCYYADNYFKEGPCTSCRYYSNFKPKGENITSVEEMEDTTWKQKI